jgi:hypothetical protein
LIRESVSAEMAARFDRGEWLFIDGDAKNTSQ